MAKKIQKNSAASWSRDAYLRKLAASGKPLNIRLTNDYAFRKVFKNKSVSKGFLMALLQLAEDEITDIEIVDPFEEGDGDEEKEGILDVKLHLNHDRKINIEMQNRIQEDWAERSLLYNCRMFTEGFHHFIQLQDHQTGEIYSSKFLFHVIELKKLEDEHNKTEAELWRWARLIAADDWETVQKEARGNSYMKSAVDEMERLNLSERERYLYLRRDMAISDRVSERLTAEHIGMARGIEKGEILKQIQLVQKKIQKKKPLDQIADELEDTVENILPIYEAVRQHPKDSPKKILKSIFKKDV